MTPFEIRGLIAIAFISVLTIVFVGISIAVFLSYRQEVKRANMSLPDLFEEEESEQEQKDEVVFKPSREVSFDNLPSGDLLDEEYRNILMPDLDEIEKMEEKDSSPTDLSNFLR